MWPISPPSDIVYSRKKPINNRRFILYMYNNWYWIGNNNNHSSPLSQLHRRPTYLLPMKQKTWPSRPETGPYTSLPFQPNNFLGTINNNRSIKSVIELSTPPNFNPKFSPPSTSSRPSDEFRDFSMLPDDVMIKIAASFTHPNLQTASLVCKAWRDALRPLREAMLFLSWGKRFKHGRGGVTANLQKALDSFLKGAARGSTLAMVDAGLLYWEMGKKEEGVALYRRAAELGDSAGQCNLGLSYLQAEPPNPAEAVKWLYQAAVAGYVRAQYQLALCLHHGRGIDRDVYEAARWYLRAAEGGYVRAMYNISLCYQWGEGLAQSHRQARKWMKRAADRGHSKAQFEHALGFFAEGEMVMAVVYLELATRAGETAAGRVKNVILQQLSLTSRARAMQLADNWRALPSVR